MNNLRVSVNKGKEMYSIIYDNTFIFWRKIIMLNKLKDLLVLKKCNSNAQNEEFM